MRAAKKPPNAPERQALNPSLVIRLRAGPKISESRVGAQRHRQSLAGGGVGKDQPVGQDRRRRQRGTPAIHGAMLRRLCRATTGSSSRTRSAQPSGRRHGGYTAGMPGVGGGVLLEQLFQQGGVTVAMRCRSASVAPPPNRPHPEPRWR